MVRCQCRRFLLSEWRLAMFSTVDTNQKTIDFEATLSRTTRPKIVTSALKLFLVAWTISIMVLSIKFSRARDFWLAFLTSWSFLFALCYLLASLACVLLSPVAIVLWSSSSDTSRDNGVVVTSADTDVAMASTNNKAGNGNDSAAAATVTADARSVALTSASQQLQQHPTQITFFTKFVWIMFVVAVHSQVIVTLLYWFLVYDGSSVAYTQVYQHGVLLFIVMVDGYMVNRIPIRLKQIVFAYVYGFMYLIWTLIHYGTDMGNPEVMDNDPETNDDAIYGVLSWKENPKSSAILCVVIFLVVVPIIFLFIWGVSLLVPHCYYDHDHYDRDRHDDDSNDNIVEQSSNYVVAVVDEDEEDVVKEEERIYKDDDDDDAAAARS